MDFREAVSELTNLNIETTHHIVYFQGIKNHLRALEIDQIKTQHVLKIAFLQ